MKKKDFENPNMEVVALTCEDIITSSANDLFSNGVRVGGVQVTEINKEVPADITKD